MAIPKFPHASASFRANNPHLFPTDGEQKFTLHEGPQVPTKAEMKSEKELQEQIVGFLERNNTVVIRSRMDRKTSTNVGTPDLLFAINGRAIAYEVKLRGKKPTREQVDMMQRMGRNGWACYVVETYDNAVEIFRELSA